MKLWTLLFLTLTSSAALALENASIVCTPTQIREYPNNPAVFLIEQSSSKFEVVIIRSYYGYGFEEAFFVKPKNKSAGSVEFTGEKSILTLFPQNLTDSGFEGQLQSEEYGSTTLNCKKK